jgi:hypothetical protein
MLLEVLVDFVVGVGLDFAVEVVVVPHFLDETFLVVGIAVSDEGPGRQRCALVEAEGASSSHSSAAYFSSSLGGFSGDGLGQIGVLGGEVQEGDDGLG